MKKLFFTLLLLFPIITSAQSSMNVNLLGTYDYATTARMINLELTERTLLRITDLLGREVNLKTIIGKTTLFYIYNDGTAEKRIVVE